MGSTEWGLWGLRDSWPAHVPICTPNQPFLSQSHYKIPYIYSISYITQLTKRYVFLLIWISVGSILNFMNHYFWALIIFKNLTPALAGGYCEDHRLLNRFLRKLYHWINVVFLVIILNLILSTIFEMKILEKQFFYKSQNNSKSLQRAFWFGKTTFSYASLTKKFLSSLRGHSRSWFLKLVKI